MNENVQLLINILKEELNSFPYYDNLSIEIFVDKCQDLIKDFENEQGVFAPYEYEVNLSRDI